MYDDYSLYHSRRTLNYWHFYDYVCFHHIVLHQLLRLVSKQVAATVARPIAGGVIGKSRLTSIFKYDGPIVVSISTCTTPSLPDATLTEEKVCL